MFELVADVCAATVTYGDRAELCRNTVRAALAAGADRVVIIDNGSEHRSAAQLQVLASDPRVELLRLEKNLGSAGGFAAAIQQGVSSDFVWLLDDDSEFGAGALDALRAVFNQLGSGSGSGRVALSSLRAGNRFQQQSIEIGRSVLPSAGSFMSFDLRRPRRRSMPRSGEARRGPVRVPYGPYGGLFLRAADLKPEMLPDPRLVLYEDDTDFTSRLTRAGFELWLIPNSQIHDADAKWSEQAGGERGPIRLFRAQNDVRLFHAVRNRTRFDFQMASTLRLRLALAANFVVYMAIALVQAATAGRWHELCVMQRAVWRGMTGDLSPAPTGARL